MKDEMKIQILLIIGIMLSCNFVLASEDLMGNLFTTGNITISGIIEINPPLVYEVNGSCYYTKDYHIEGGRKVLEEGVKYKFTFYHAIRSWDLFKWYWRSCLF